MPALSNSAPPHPRLVLVGGGHAHLQVLEDLERDPLAETDVVLIADRRGAVYSGMVPGLVAGQYSCSELTVDLKTLAERSGAEFIEQAAVRIEPNERRVRLRDGSVVSYAVASLNIGSTVAGLELPGVREYALPTRPIGDLVRRLDGLERTPPEVLVVGGGAGGVELAFCIEARPTAGGRPRVTLMTAADGLLSPRRRRLARRVRKAMERRNIRLFTGSTAVAVEDGILRTARGSSLSFDLLLWATGAAAHPLAADSSLATDARGFAWVRSTLQTRDHPELFAVGDCAALIDYPQTPKAGVYAVRQGPVLTHNLRRVCTPQSSGEGLRVYRPQTDFLTLVNLGDGTALGSRFGLTFGGGWTMRWKDRIDRRFVNRFPSRAD